MRPLTPAQVHPELRQAVADMLDRLDGADAVMSRTVVAPGWEPFAEAIGLSATGRVATGEAASSASHALVAVGPIATAIAAVGEQPAPLMFGFVAPAAIRSRVKLRHSTRFLDPTSDVWAAGWSPLAVRRIDVTAPAQPGAPDRSDTSAKSVGWGRRSGWGRRGGSIEVVVGHARPTPLSLVDRNWQPR